MESIKSLITGLQQQKHGTERGELLEFFTAKINATRDGKKYKKLHIAAIAVKLSHIPTKDLYYLKSVCLDAEREGKPFSAIFWWSIKGQTK